MAAAGTQPGRGIHPVDATGFIRESAEGRSRPGAVGARATPRVATAAGRTNVAGGPA